jgi:hypothetical protein
VNSGAAKRERCGRETRARRWVRWCRGYLPSLAPNSALRREQSGSARSRGVTSVCPRAWRSAHPPLRPPVRPVRGAWCCSATPRAQAALIRRDGAASALTTHAAADTLRPCLISVTHTRARARLRHHVLRVARARALRRLGTVLQPQRHHALTFGSVHQLRLRGGNRSSWNGGGGSPIMR